MNRIKFFLWLLAHLVLVVFSAFVFNIMSLEEFALFCAEFIAAWFIALSMHVTYQELDKRGE